MDNEDDYQKYIYEKTNFKKCQKDNFKNFDSILMNSLNEIDKQYLSLCNSIFIKNKKTDTNSETSNKIFNDNLIKLLLLLFDYEKFNKKIKPLIEYRNKGLNSELFEIILFGFRFYVQTIDINENENLLYSSLFNKKFRKFKKIIYSWKR